MVAEAVAGLMVVVVAVNYEFMLYEIDASNSVKNDFPMSDYVSERAN